MKKNGRVLHRRLASRDGPFHSLVTREGAAKRWVWGAQAGYLCSLGTGRSRPPRPQSRRPSHGDSDRHRRPPRTALDRDLLTRVTSPFVPHPPMPTENGTGVPKLNGAQHLQPSHQMSDLSFDFGAGGSVVGLPRRVGLPRASAGERLFVEADVDRSSPLVEVVHWSASGQDRHAWRTCEMCPSLIARSGTACPVGQVTVPEFSSIRNVSFA
jgi:hypothetical protein